MRLVLKPARATRFTGRGLGGERFQPVPPAEILDFVKPRVEGRHAGVVDGRFIRRVDRECPVRGAEQVYQRRRAWPPTSRPRRRGRARPQTARRRADGRRAPDTEYAASVSTLRAR